MAARIVLGSSNLVLRPHWIVYWAPQPSMHWPVHAPMGPLNYGCKRVTLLFCRSSRLLHLQEGRIRLLHSRMHPLQHCHFI